MLLSYKFAASHLLHLRIFGFKYKMKYTSVNCVQIIGSRVGRTTSQSLLHITTSRCIRRLLQHRCNYVLVLVLCEENRFPVHCKHDKICSAANRWKRLHPQCIINSIPDSSKSKNFWFLN